MCTGAEIAAVAVPLVTGAAQTYFQGQAADEQSKARNAAQELYQNDLNDIREKAVVNFDSSVQAASQPTQEQLLEEAVLKRTADNTVKFNQNELLPGQGNASKAVRTAIVQAQNQGAASNQSEAERKARLDAFGDADLATNIALLQNAQKINTFSGFAQGANNTLQADLNAAGYEGQDELGIADAIGAVGAVAGAGLGAYNAGTVTSGTLNNPAQNAAGQNVGTYQKSPSSISGV